MGAPMDICNFVYKRGILSTWRQVFLCFKNTHLQVVADDDDDNMGQVFYVWCLKMILLTGSQFT